MVAESYSSLFSNSLMLLVSHFTSSGQRAKLTVLGCLLPPFCLCLSLLNSLLSLCPFVNFIITVLLFKSTRPTSSQPSTSHVSRSALPNRTRRTNLINKALLQLLCQQCHWVNRGSAFSLAFEKECE